MMNYRRQDTRREPSPISKRYARQSYGSAFVWSLLAIMLLEAVT